MEYMIYLDGALLFDSKNGNSYLISATGNNIMNDFSTFEFTLLFGCDVSIETGATLVEVFKDSKKVFAGVPVVKKSNMDNQGLFTEAYTCKSLISQLNNVILNTDKTYNQKSKAVIDDILNQYNSKATMYKVNGRNISVNKDLIYELKTPITVYEALMEIVDIVGGYIVVDNVGKALNISHLPIVNGGELLGDINNTLMVEQTLDGTLFKNGIMAVSEWEEEVPIYGWIDNGNAIPNNLVYDNYKGLSSIVGANHADLVQVNTHFDNRYWGNGFKDWVGIFGYGGGYPQPYYQHNGIDIQASVGTPLYSPPFWTKVIDVNWSNASDDRGLYVFLEVVDYGTQRVKQYGQFYYLHMSSIEPSVGQLLAPNTWIGRTGNTGLSSGPHLHFGVSFNYYGSQGGGLAAGANLRDPYQYIFNIGENSFDPSTKGLEGWNTFIVAKEWGIIGYKMEPRQIVKKIVDADSYKKFGGVYAVIRNNDLRTQADVDALAQQSLNIYLQIGLNRSVELDLAYISADIIGQGVTIGNVPFMNGEDTHIVGYNYDVLNPQNDKLIVDNEPLSFIKMIGGGNFA
ncbi:M23 family metallopeptidase [Culicoidibacter larvae]|uniref:M23 family metallopeptidase n=1 Tax=Culicoidibacter larvae TaxID=2579976 RepID=A0A5R8Q8U9_9FIRM|nr:M23 family metallopeptidase [Culicoidibacter larvae]TLG72045.1 M23 family metallopeptidase [Culicoidibacter larvae]